MNELDIDNKGNFVIHKKHNNSGISFLLEDFFDKSPDKLKNDIELCQDKNKKLILKQFLNRFANGELDFFSDSWQEYEPSADIVPPPPFSFGLDKDGFSEFTAKNVIAIHSGFWYAADNLANEIKNIERYKNNYEGYKIAVDKIDIVIPLIKKAADFESALKDLQTLGLSKSQAEAFMYLNLNVYAEYSTDYLQERISICDRLTKILKEIQRVSLCTKLQESPMFQLSLSSKELFHSNFLYWISQFNIEMFKYIIKQLFENAGKSLNLEEWYEGFKVKREHKHYDLCVTNEDENTILLVIENKVKSIPNKTQLDNYYSESNKAQHLLLSLSIDFPEFEEIKNEWAIANYQELAQTLSEYVENRVGYEYDIIRDYIRYISNFHSLVEGWRESIETVSYPFCPKVENLNELRMNDFYTKFYFSQILLQITKELKKEYEDVEFNWKPIFGTDNKLTPPSKNILYINSGLTNGNGFLEVKVKIEPDIAILIQIQGEQYRRCVEYYYDNNGSDNKHASLEKNIDCLRNDTRLNRFFALEKSGKLSIPYPQSIGLGYPFRKMKDEYRNGFCKYGNQFIYQYFKIKDRTIDNIIKAVVEDINNFRSIVGRNDSD